ncbi:MAG: hypothetical protein LBH81_02060 [Rickettsiales bacterium]|jgi:hypothetical protein|nr:hypothetical protein [Rickettsiales bacterium]
MIKKAISLCFVCALLAACAHEPQVEFVPANIVNMHYERLYTNADFTSADYLKEGGELAFGKKVAVWPCVGECVEAGMVESIRFYKDAERKCLLFSVPNEEILSLFYDRQDAIRNEFMAKNDPVRSETPGYMENDQLKKSINGVVVAIFKDGKTLALSRNEIETIRPSIRPNPKEAANCATF